MNNFTKSLKTVYWMIQSLMKGIHYSQNEPIIYKLIHLCCKEAFLMFLESVRHCCA